MPEFTAPGVGRQSTQVTIDAEFGENANGVLYAVGGSGGGLSVYMDDGHLVYEYNMMIIENYQARTDKIPAGKHQIVIDTTIAKPAGPADVVITIDGKEAARTTVKRTVPAAFTATEVVRRRRRPRLDRVAVLRGQAAVRLRRQDRTGAGDAVAARRRAIRACRFRQGDRIR